MAAITLETLVRVNICEKIGDRTYSTPKFYCVVQLKHLGSVTECHRQGVQRIMSELSAGKEPQLFVTQRGTNYRFDIATHMDAKIEHDILADRYFGVGPELSLTEMERFRALVNIYG